LRTRTGGQIKETKDTKLNEFVSENKDLGLLETTVHETVAESRVQGWDDIRLLMDLEEKEEHGRTTKDIKGKKDSVMIGNKLKGSESDYSSRIGKRSDNSKTFKGIPVKKVDILEPMATKELHFQYGLPDYDSLACKLDYVMTVLSQVVQAMGELEEKMEQIIKAQPITQPSMVPSIKPQAEPKKEVVSWKSTKYVAPKWEEERLLEYLPIHVF